MRNWRRVFTSGTHELRKDGDTFTARMYPQTPDMARLKLWLSRILSLLASGAWMIAAVAFYLGLDAALSRADRSPGSDPTVMSIGIAVFVGVPALLLGLALFGIARWLKRRAA